MTGLKPLNSAIVINKKDVVLSFNIPRLRSVQVDHNNFPFLITSIISHEYGTKNILPTDPEVDFNRRMDQGGLGIKDGDLYYITTPINTYVHVVDVEGKKTIIECTADGVKEISL